MLRLASDLARLRIRETISPVGLAAKNRIACLSIGTCAAGDCMW